MRYFLEALYVLIMVLFISLGLFYPEELSTGATVLELAFFCTVTAFPIFFVKWLIVYFIDNRNKIKLPADKFMIEDAKDILINSDIDVRGNEEYILRLMKAYIKQ